MKMSPESTEEWRRKALLCHHPLPITAEFSLQDNKERQGRERKYYERPFDWVKIDGYFLTLFLEKDILCVGDL